MVRRQNRFVPAACAALIAAFLACARAGAAAESSEHLLLVPPHDWVLANQQHEGDTFTIEYVPRGQSAADWDERIQAQIFYGITGLAGADFLANLLRLYGDQCPDAAGGAADLRQAAGYRVTGRLLFCGASPADGMGEITMFKVMEGAAGLYAVSRTWRGPAFAASALPMSEFRMQQWAGFFGLVRLCDDTNPEAPCPAGE